MFFKKVLSKKDKTGAARPFHKPKGLGTLATLRFGEASLSFSEHSEIQTNKGLATRQRGVSLSWLAHARSGSRGQGRPSGAASAGLTLDGGASAGNSFSFRMVRRAALLVFLFSRRRLFSTSSPIGTSGALKRRRFRKSLISGWFLYSNQSCCAAPFWG